MNDFYFSIKTKFINFYDGVKFIFNQLLLYKKILSPSSLSLKPASMQFWYKFFIKEHPQKEIVLPITIFISFSPLKKKFSNMVISFENSTQQVEFSDFFSPHSKSRVDAYVNLYEEFFQNKEKIIFLYEQCFKRLFYFNTKYVNDFNTYYENSFSYSKKVSVSDQFMFKFIVEMYLRSEGYY